MTTRARVPVFLSLLLALAPATPGASPWPEPAEGDLSTACTEQGMRVSVSAFSTDVGMQLVVRRVETAPGLLGPLTLTSEPIVLPFAEPVVHEFDDPAVGPGDVGFYAVDFLWPDDALYGTEYYQVSCTARPFLMRGHLVGDEAFAPCTGQGLLECPVVDLYYADDLQYVGTGELVEVHGWVIDLVDRGDCTVGVVDVVPLGTGVTCEDVVPNATVSWGALKASYR